MFLCGLTLCSVILCSTAIQSAVGEEHKPAEKVRMVLKSNVQIDQDLVSVGDVVSFFGGSNAQRNKLAALDLDDLSSANASPIILSAEEIRIRILLSGFNASLFELQGARSVAVKRDWSKPHMRQIERILVDAIVAGTQVPAADVMLTVTGVSNRKLIEGDRGRLEFSLLVDGKQAIGRREVRMNALQNGVPVAFFDALVDSSIVLDAPVASKSIQRGDVFSKENVTFQRTQFKRWTGSVLTAQDLFGQPVGRPIAEGGQIDSTRVRRQAVAAKQANKKLIRARDPVIVLADMGSVQIALNNAVALNSGSAGDLIRVQNETTRKVLTCRVIDERRVKVVY